MKFTIDSSAVRGEYMRNIVDRTVNDIHNTLATVFGPYGNDAYIHKNGQLYYTRDGKEVLASISYDNVISNDVLKLIYQAVERQATLVGDGTTTLAVLYTALYNAFQETMYKTSSKYTGVYREVTINRIRSRHKIIVNALIESLKGASVEMTDDKFMDMVYTCTQDVNLTNLIYDKLHDAVKEQAYMVIGKSNLDDELEVEIHNEPLIKAEKIYSTYSVPLDTTKIANTVVLYVDGVLDISDVSTLVGLGSISTEDNRDDFPNILILCSGTTQATRNIINEYQTAVSSAAKANPDKKGNNVIIAKILNTAEYNEDMKEDLIAYLYNMVGVGGLVNSITFEALLHQAFNMVGTSGSPVERFMAVDFDPQILDTMRTAFFTRREVAFAPGTGLRLYGTLPFVAKERYDELVHMIETEKDGVKVVDLKRRLRTVYGKFIEVKVGSMLIKESQRKYELILDAVKSSMDAYRNGILLGNSLIRLAGCLDALDIEAPDMDTSIIDNIIIDTFKSALNRVLKYILIPMNINDHPYDKAIRMCELDDVEEFTVCDGPLSEDISGKIVEPLNIITMILKNSIIPFELSCAEVFCVDASMRNYID